MRCVDSSLACFACNLRDCAFLVAILLTDFSTNRGIYGICNGCCYKTMVLGAKKTMFQRKPLYTAFAAQSLQGHKFLSLCRGLLLKIDHAMPTAHCQFDVLPKSAETLKAEHLDSRAHKSHQSAADLEELVCFYHGHFYNKDPCVVQEPRRVDSYRVASGPRPTHSLARAQTLTRRRFLTSGAPYGMWRSLQESSLLISATTAERGLLGKSCRNQVSRPLAAVEAIRHRTTQACGTPQLGLSWLIACWPAGHWPRGRTRVGESFAG